MPYRLLVGCAVLALAAPALAQHEGHAMPAEAPAMEHSQMDHGAMHHGDEPDRICTTDLRIPHYAEGSGTARLPGFEGTMGGGCIGAPSPHTGGIHLLHDDDTMVMAHGFVSGQYTDHGGPRGDDKFYSTSMAMLMADHDTDWGRLQFKSMLSLEPAMDADGYPNLFATGETAGGEALVDRQHPHDLFMELAGRVDVDIVNGTSLFLYGGPVGEPALGPSAFMHRGSASLNPEPPITHHWFDSTHITYGVVTAGVSNPRFQLEASAFRGAEPGEDRWDIETPKLDSWSARATWTPDPRWAIQASYGEITEPEALHPGEDEHRFTASAHYADIRGFSGMLAFSSKKRVEAGEHLDDPDEEHHESEPLTAWLAEVSYDFADRHTVFGRFENVNNDELFPDHDDPLHEERFRVSKFQAGYAYSLPMGDSFSLALGGSLSAYAKPDALDPFYGDNPLGYTLFARFMLGQ